MAGAPYSEDHGEVQGFNEKIMSGSSLMIERLGKNAKFVVLESWRPQAELLKRIRKEKPDHVAVTVYDEELELAKKFIEGIRKASPQTKIDVGGPMPTNNALFCAYYLNADSVFAGNAVKPYDEYLRITNSGLPVSKIVKKLAGIRSGVFRLGENREKLVGNRPTKPAWLTQAEVDSEMKTDSLVKAMDEDVLHIFTSFGCPSRKQGCRCVFCSMHFKAAVAMSGKRIVEELKKVVLASGKGKIRVVFDDDDFLVDRNRTLEFLKDFRKFGLHKKVRFSFMTNPASLLLNGEIDYELINELEKANWGHVQFGTESFSEIERDRLGKPSITNEKLEELIRILDERAIGQGHFNIISNPRTTLDSLRDNLENANRIIDKYKTVRIGIPYPGLFAVEGSLFGNRIAADAIKDPKYLEAFYFAKTPYGFVTHLKPALYLNKEFGKFYEYHTQKVSELPKKQIQQLKLHHNLRMKLLLKHLEEFAPKIQGAAT
ncbi:MAG: cobalamin-dependent protein [Candidatus Micrarchaeota archaeon]